MILRLLMLGLVVGLPAAAQDTPDPDRCAALPLGAAFCGDLSGWDAEPLLDGDLAAASTGDILLAVQVIPFDGTASQSDLRHLMNVGIAEAAGLPVLELPVLRRDSLAVGEVRFDRLVYLTAAEGQSYTVANSLHLGDGYALIAITQEAGESFTESHDAAHQRALAALRLPEQTETDVQ